MSILSPNRLKAKIAPHLHWRVPFEAGMYENSPRWSNKGELAVENSTTKVHKLTVIALPDLDPIPPEKRTWGGIVCHLVPNFTATF